MNTRVRTGLIAAAVTGGTILGATQVGSLASAQTDDPGPVDTTDETLDDEERPDRPGRRGHRGAHLDGVADLLGIDDDAVREALRDGTTLAELAAQNGVAVDAVIDTIVTAQQEHLDEAVADGRITEDEAAEKAADLAERVTTMVEEGRPEGARGPGGRRGASLEGVADLLGMEPQAVRDSLRDGSTLADLATENGVAIDAVVGVIVAEHMERLDEAVADGRITADEAAEKSADLEDRVTTRVTDGRP